MKINQLVKTPIMLVLFIIVSFSIMTMVTYNFGVNREREFAHIVTNETFYSIENHLSLDIRELETIISIMGTTVRQMMLDDISMDVFEDYIVQINEHERNRNGISGFEVLFVYAPFYNRLSISGWGVGWDQSLASDYDATGRLWYTTAIEANGEIAVTVPYVSVTVNDYVMTYTQALFCDDGELLAIIAAHISLVRMLDLSSRASYAVVNWMLINEDGLILTHYNKDFLGKNIGEISPEFYNYFERYKDGETIENEDYISYSGEASLLSIRQLENEWYLCIFFPREIFKSTLDNMLGFLIVISLIICTVLCITIVIIYRRSDAIEKKSWKVEQANIYKTAFLTNMSHEIRTPMNAILGIAELKLHENHLNKDMRESFEMIYDSGSLLLNIINDILDLSKVEANKLEVNPYVYDIPSLINDTAQLNAIRYDNKPIEFLLHIDENTPLKLNGDAIRIKQIINNILSNAFKYTNEGAIDFSINSEKVDDTISNLIITIRDSGVGMSEEQVKNIFNEYSRFNFGAARTVPGTGLGMAICKKVVDLLNGELSIESKVGRGTSVTVKIPQERVGNEVCGTTFTNQLSETSFKHFNITKQAQFIKEHMPYGKVLIVDDVKSNLYVAKNILSTYGLNIDSAFSGYDAISLINSGKVYDIIFMDYMMPYMDGVETVATLRKMGYNKPIVALTANAFVGQQDMFLNNGFDDFLSKPIDTRNLNVVLNNFIRDKYPIETREAARKEKQKMLEEAAKVTSVNIDNMSVEDLFIYDSEEAIMIIDELLSKENLLHNGDLEKYIITIHGLKSALANIGETELSNLALQLEKAGNDHDINFIKINTPRFISELSALINKKAKIDGIGTNLNILVVDDVSVNLKIAKSMLLSLGAKVGIAKSGEIAIEMAALDKYDMIFMDYKMPEMDGIETTKRLRETGEEICYLKTVPIIALSASDADIEHKFLNNGFNDFMPKPIEIEKLESIIKKHRS